MLHAPAAILFDLDGTLLDTAWDLGNALNHVLTLHGLPTCPYAAYRPIASDGAKGLLSLGFGDKLQDFDISQLRDKFLAFYQRNLCVDTRLFDGVAELIQQLDSKAVPWGIVTNKPGYLTDALLPHFASLADCKVVVSGDTLTERKPHPQPLLFAAQALGSKPHATWYVGDAERDIQAAISAGMPSVLAEYGYIGDQQQTAHWQPDLRIHRAGQLLDYL